MTRKTYLMISIKIFTTLLNISVKHNRNFLTCKQEDANLNDDKSIPNSGYE